jgi:beta-phosphoglucomutase
MAERGIIPPEIEFYRRESERGPESIKHFYRAAGRPEPDQAEIDAVLERVVELYYRYPTVKPMAGALEFVARARARGIQTAIVTGSPKKHIFQRLTDEQRGLFDVLIGSDDVPRGKPFPDPYQHAVRLLGLPARDLFVIENSPFGIASAKAAGLLTVGLTSTLPREDLMAADLVVDSLARLAGWMGI